MITSNFGMKRFILAQSLAVRGLWQELEVEVIQEHRLLPCSHSLLSLPLYMPQDSLPRRGLTHKGLGPATSVINQEHVPTNLPIGDLMETCSQLRTPLPR